MKIKKKDFKVFKKECKRLIHFFGLTDWDVNFKHEHIDDCFADINTDCQTRKVTIRLGKEYFNQKWKGPKESAMHEVGHLFICDLVTMAQNGEASWLVYKYNEIFATKFVNALYKKI